MTYIPIININSTVRNQWGEDQVRISYILKPKPKKHWSDLSLVISIGIDVAKKLGFNDKDKLMIYKWFDIETKKENPYQILLKKSTTKAGWMLRKSRYKKITSEGPMRTELKWREFEPNPNERRAHAVEWDIYEGGLVVYLNKPLTPLPNLYAPLDDNATNETNYV